MAVALWHSLSQANGAVPFCLLALFMSKEDVDKAYMKGPSR